MVQYKVQVKERKTYFKGLLWLRQTYAQQKFIGNFFVCINFFENFWDYLKFSFLESNKSFWNHESMRID